MAYSVYILECADSSLYVGVTTDVDRRVSEHNGSKLGARYTKARRPVVLRYHEHHESRSDAQKREAALKKMSRAQKLDLIRTIE